MKLVVVVSIFLCLLVGFITSQALPDITTQIPSNYSYPIVAATIFEGEILPVFVSTRDVSGNLFSCFTTDFPFKIGNSSYTPSGYVMYLVKLTSNLQLAWVREYTQINSGYPCKKIVLDKLEKNIYFEVENVQIIKTDMQSGNISLIWDQIGAGFWDIVDEDKIVFTQIVQATISNYLAPVCPTGLPNYYIAVGILNTTSVLSYQCFIEQNGASEPAFIAYHNGKIYLYGKVLQTLTLLNASLTGQGNIETAFIARIDLMNNVTDFATTLGYFGAFSSVEFAKDFSYVSFVFSNRGDSYVLGQYMTSGARLIKVAIPAEAGAVPRLVYFSPILVPGDDIPAFPQHVAGINKYVANSPAAFLYRYYDNQALGYNLALFPIENGLISNYKVFPTLTTEGELTLSSLFVGNNQKHVTLVFRTTNSTLISGINSNAGNQVAFVTLLVPTLPPSPSPAEVIGKYENLESEYANLQFNGTNFVVDGNITLVTGSGATLMLDKETEIVTENTVLNIEVLQSNLNLESYTAETPLVFDVFATSDSTSATGQLVGNGYQVGSNARINKLEICINMASSLKLKQSYYQTPAIAVKVSGSNRFQVESNMVVARRGNQLCTRAATTSPVVYPALIGTAPQSSVKPPVTGSAWINSISFAAIILALIVLC